MMLKLLLGRKDEIEARKERRKERLRSIMLDSSVDDSRVLHAAIRWYGLRRKHETDSLAEFGIYDEVLGMLANLPPSWIAREFPAEKEYDGDRRQSKDWYSSVNALRSCGSFNGNTQKLLDFLWDWNNRSIRQFVISGLLLIDELRALQGQESLAVEFADAYGIPVYRQRGAAFFDGEGKFVGRVQKHLRRVK